MRSSSSVPLQAFNSFIGLLRTLTHNNQAFAAHNGSNFISNQRHGQDHTFSNPRNYSNQGRGMDLNLSNFRSNNQKYNNRLNQRYNRVGRSNFNLRKIICQICKHFDHEAFECPHRMNPTYGNKNAHSAMYTNTSSNTPT